MNNRLGLEIDLDTRRAYNSAVDFTLNSNLSVIVNYSERVYPAAQNAYKPEVRGRQNYTINNIWNDSRDKRSTTYGGQPGSQGQVIANSSIWPMDGHVNFTTTSSVKAEDGAGELMNSYSRFTGSSATLITAAPTYASRIPMGTTTYASNLSVLVGDVQWLAGEQSGKQPYQNYSSYAETMRLVGKDYSIVPEFRISEHMDTYINLNEGDFLTSIDSVFDLTGALVNNSSDDIFYKTYTNGDFLRYFGVIDDDLNEQRSEDLKIVRDKVVLKCDALVKFLPYKGFYPAERTLELATLFSQSYGESVATTAAGFRILLEPMMAPGILFNTIKSGLGVSNIVLKNTGSAGGGLPSRAPQFGLTAPLTYTFAAAPNGANVPISASNIIYAPLDQTNKGNGYVPIKLPFETIYKPEDFFNQFSLPAVGGAAVGASSTTLFDTAMTNGLALLPAASRKVNVKTFAGSKLYRLAMDNFLCETTTMFLDNMANFKSAREENFKPVKSGSIYKMEMKLYQTNRLGGLVEVPDTARFTMYNNVYGFGTPLFVTGDESAEGLTYTHVTPPYYGGPALLTFTYTATVNGPPTLDEVLANTTITVARNNQYSHNLTGSGPASISNLPMQINDCFDVTEVLNEVPPGTVTQKKRWLIQSKFETPVLNFANVSSSVPPTSSVTIADSANDFRVKGMWHQYGSVPSGSDIGVFALLNAGSGSNHGSLADITGFPVGAPVRVGATKKEYKLEEAIVAIPYRQSNNRRRFIELEENQRQSDTYKKMVAAMNKYVFPPKFDFTRFSSINPLLMYIFEFSADLTQKDISDIWQNLPPDLSEKFETKEAVVEEQELLDLILTKDTETHWLVFKVKKRAQKDYELVRRALVGGDISALSPNIESEYSYNWPYDYFSLVELAKMEEKVQYASRDLAPPAPTRTGDDTPPPAIANAGATTSRARPATSGAPGSAASLANPEQAVTTRAPQTQAAPTPTTTRIQPVATSTAPISSTRQAAATTAAGVGAGSPTTATQAATRTTRGRGRGGGGRGGSY